MVKIGNFWLFVIIFLLIGAFVIVSSNNLELDEKQDQKTFLGQFGKWIWQVGKNVKNTVGFVIQQEWLPEDEQSKKINETGQTFVVVGK